MLSSIDSLLRTPSRASWNELRRRWTALPPTELQLDAWDAALADWPDAWRVASPSWLRVASLARSWPMPARDEWSSPLLRLARSLDFAHGRAIAPSDRVLDALSQIDLSRITHVRHQEHRPYLSPRERILARLIRASAYRAVTHLAIEWPTADELAALALLPSLEELEILRINYMQSDRGSLVSPGQLAQGLAALPSLIALRANAEVWTAVRETPLFARLRRGLDYEQPVGLAAPEPVAFSRWMVSEFVAQTAVVPHITRGDERSAATAAAMIDSPPRPIAPSTTDLLVVAHRKIAPKIAREWAAIDLNALPLAAVYVDVSNLQPLPVRVRAPHVIVSGPAHAESLLEPGATLKVLELRVASSIKAGDLWTASTVNAVLDRLGAGLEVFVLLGSEMTADERAALLAHPALRGIRALCLEESGSLKVGRKFEPRPRGRLELPFVKALSELSSLRWLRLQHFEISEDALGALRMPQLFGIDIDLTSARKLGHATQLLTPELEVLRATNLGGVARTGDELLHVPALPHLARVELSGLPRHEDDDESLEYAVGGVLAPRLGAAAAWLDEPA